jgi:hypothetical protein
LHRRQKQGALGSAAALAALASLTAACTEPPTPPVPTVTGVTIQGGDRTLVEGETTTLTADVRVQGNASTAVTWSSQSATVATIDDQGDLTAIAEGATTITAASTHDPAITDDVTVTIHPPGMHHWTRQFGTSGTDHVRAVAVDDDGNVIIAGSTTGDLEGVNAGAPDAYVRKLDAQGDHLWTRQFGTDGADYASAVVVDQGGDIIVVGYTTGDLDGANTGVHDAYVRKLDPQGNHLWTRQFGTSSSDFTEDTAVDQTGNIFVVGATHGDLEGANAGSLDAFVRKVDSDGNHLWTRQFGTDNADYANSSAVDQNGNVFVAGSTYGDLDGANAGGYDAYVRKLDPQGDHLWTRQFGTSISDYAEAAAVDADGNVIVGGNTWSDLEGANAGSTDAYVRKLDAQGDHLWTRQFGTDAGDYVNAVATDHLGNVVITGDTWGDLAGANAGGQDAFVRKIDRLGDHLWSRQLGTSSKDAAWDVATDSSGSIVIVGDTGGGIVGTSAGEVDAFVRAYGR